MLRHLPGILSTLGPLWLVNRLRFATEAKLGLLERRTPARPWSSWPTSGFVALKGIGTTEASESTAIDALVAGAAPFLKGIYASGLPPKWHVNPLGGASAPADIHWSKLGDFDFGDIKGIWEGSRWGWAYSLCRHWLATKDPRAPELFWLWADDWLANNPPNLGPNWKCGQEASFRLFAAAYALSVFGDHPTTTSERRASLARLAAVTGQRVLAHLDYAVSQDNNHGVSEAVGLITAGTMWPDLPEAEAWRSRGLATLEKLCRRLIAADGSFSQHSSNYHRVLLDDLCWAEAVLRAQSRTLPTISTEGGKRAADFLAALQVGQGRVTRYGADDGALILPLTRSDYGDFRPSLSAASLLGANSGEPGSHLNQISMLGKSLQPTLVKRLPRVFDARNGGIHIRRSELATVFFRAPTQFKFRPSHADQLHISLYEPDGTPVADDVGTISYNDPSRPWAALGSARFHNVPVVDEGDPMEKVSRFLWLPWTECRLEVCEPDRLVASHKGFKGFTIQREILIHADRVEIRDTFEGRHLSDLSIRWNGPDRDRLARLSLSCDTPGAVESWHTQEPNGLGWRADRYATPQPSWCRILRLRARSATFTTIYSPKGA
jgi:hypothetical protein